ncbi:MAG: MFS transporter [Alistipes senegalensis]|nr:MFS transporter [Oxalobacter formigenes]MCM1281066.1 MFS transporter [Alistipes senegalensis]
MRQPFPDESLKMLHCMVACYAAGAFNRYFLRQGLLFLAAASGAGYLRGSVIVLFILPFIVCSAWAGWMADRMPKSRLVVYAKLAEAGIMLLGAIALAGLNWAGLVIVVLLMGIQSAFFSPPFHGLIPEAFPVADVPRVNSLITIAAAVVLPAGMALGGLLPYLPAFLPGESLPEGIFGQGRLLLGGMAVLVAAAGVEMAFRIRINREMPVANEPFPLLGPLDSVRYAWQYKKKDPALFLALSAETFFYALLSFAMLCMGHLVAGQLGMGMLHAGLLATLLCVGIIAGAARAGKQHAVFWRRSVLFAGGGMIACILIFPLAVFLPAELFIRDVFLGVICILTGIFAGRYLIPLISIIQIRPGATEKGKVLGLSNFATFSGMFLAGFIFAIFDWVHELTGSAQPAGRMAWGALAGLLFLFWFLRCLKKQFPGEHYSLLGAFLRFLLSFRYRITASGLDTLSVKGPALFLPNHPALVDPFIVYSLLADYAPRPLADEHQFAGWHGKAAARILDAVTIPDMMKDGFKAVGKVQKGLLAILHSLKAGRSVLMYPSGRIYRSPKERVGGNSGTWSLVQQAEGVQIILVRTSGLWGSTFSYGATGDVPYLGRAFLQGILTVLGNFFLFVPKRPVQVDFVEADELAAIADRREFNRQLEAFYNETEQPAISVPRWFWQGTQTTALPAHPVYRNRLDTGSIPPDIRKTVYDILRRTAMLEPDFPLHDSMSLSHDLGMDSLMLMEAALEMEGIGKQAFHNPEELETVADCLLAAIGQHEAVKPVPPAPDIWFFPSSVGPLSLPSDHSCLVSAFLRQLRHNPKEPLLAERDALYSRKRLFLGALILAVRFAKFPDERIGIMMPSVPAVTVVWMAALLAGKTPVFFNWTTGEANFRHCVDLAGIRHIVSVTPLIERLSWEGLKPGVWPVEWLALDSMVASFSLREKLCGVFKAAIMRQARYFPVPRIAAVLFTSGSESLPKAVPLTHENLLSNAADIIQVLNLASQDTVLAMLPPFHSFGLMVGLVIPLSTGIRAVFHPNPAEPALLNGLVQDYRISLLAMPPTFLGAMLEQAKGTDRLASVKYAFVGAEKCPEQIYQDFAAQCPMASLCEGYGITECSPAVSVNRPGEVQPGTIGFLLPSMSAAIVKEKDGVITGRVVPEETGMLLLRGPNVFGGYLGEALSPFVEFEGNTWYRTGDLVSMDKAGRLIFQGRMKRFVKIGGEMVSLPQIEEVLLKAFSSHPARPEEGVMLAVEAAPEEDGAEIVLFTSLPLTLDEVRAAIRKAGLSPLYTVRRIEKVTAIPILGSGKTDYRALRERLLH